MDDLVTEIQQRYADAESLLGSGQPAAARAKLEGLLPLLERAGDRVGQGRVLFQIGKTYEQFGSHAAARHCYAEALTALGDADTAHRAAVLHRLGHMIRASDPAAAREQFEQSAELCQSIADRRGAALSRAMIGQIDFTSGRQESGLAAMLAALAALPADAPERAHLIEHTVYFGLRLPPERFSELVRKHVEDETLGGRLHDLVTDRRADA